MEWEWWCGSGRFYNATPITHTPLHCTPLPNPPLHPYPINRLSIKFSSQQSQGLRVNFWRLGGEWHKRCGNYYFAISVEWGVFAEVSQHAAADTVPTTLPTELFCYDFWSGQL